MLEMTGVSGMRLDEQTVFDSIFAVRNEQETPACSNTVGEGEQICLVVVLLASSANAEP